TAKDKIYAFNAAAPSPTPAGWSVDLAAYLNGQPWSCNSTTFEPCNADGLGNFEGITGTPAIDMVATPHTLYVVCAVQLPTAGKTQPKSVNACLYGLAVHITNGNVLRSTLSAGSVTGQNPDPDRCGLMACT